MTKLSPSLRTPSQLKRLSDDLLWLGLLLGMTALWCLYANLREGLGANALIVTLGALSALSLAGGVGFDRRAVANGWRRRR